MIPIGLKLPKILRDIGAVKNWAPLEAAREFDRKAGKSFE